jgi:16S rRNA (guanine527-N7)-methyltransferase
MDLQHGQDSLALARLAPEILRDTHSLVDIGTGAGFPLLPLALLRPDIPAHGVDSVAKKLKFIDTVAPMLGLKQVRTHALRAEELGQQSAHRERHGLVVSRAVGPVASLLEVGLPLLQQGGHLVLYKTEAALEELEQSRPVLQILGGMLLDPLRYRLEGDRQDRVLFLIRKIQPTPKKYPRAIGIPFHKPLTPEQSRRP